MFFGRQRRKGGRFALVTAVFAGYLLAFSPSAATTVYCIGDGGEAGFETVTAADPGCDDCSHDGAAPTGGEASLAPAGKCTDVVLTTDQDLRRSDSRPIVRGVVAVALPEALPSPGFPAAAGTRGQTALSPPRSASVALRQCTVLTI